MFEMFISSLNSNPGIITIGLSVIFGLLLKFYLPSYISKKAENLATKEDVGKITRTVEETKASISSRLHISQSRYEKEYEVYQKLTEKLVMLKMATSSLRPEIDADYNGSSDEWRNKRLKKCYKAAEDFYVVKDINRPFYPEALFKKLDKINQIAFKEATSFRMGEKVTEPKQYWNDAVKNRAEIEHLVDECISFIRERVKEWEDISD